ncbi:MAG: PilN domain-containing protein [Gemmatimonadaceae bacterium]
MIEINLLPGSGRKGRKSGGGGGAGIAAAFSGLAGRVRDPWLMGATGTVAVVLLAVGFLYVQQAARRSDLAEKQQRAVQDSTRYAAVLNEKRRAEAQRDSVLRQLNIIRSIDDNRFVWPHLMDEISRALPPYTWLSSVIQTSVPQSAAAAAAPVPAGAPGAPAAAPGARDSIDVVAPRDTVKFQIIGNTVDIQALTRFMRLLEASQFVEKVELSRSQLVITDGKEVTQFVLNAQYEEPHDSAIRTVPVALSVR